MLGSTLAVLNGRKKFNLSELQKAIAKAGGGAIYDPSTLWGAVDHLPRRNLLTYTEDFSNAVWNANSGDFAVTAGQADHLGGNAACKLVIPNGSAFTLATGVGYYNLTYVQSYSYAFSVGSYKLSYYVKTSGIDGFQIRIGAATNASSPTFAGAANFASDGTTVGTVTNATETFESVGSGWYKVTLSFIVSTAATLYICMWQFHKTAKTSNGTDGLLQAFASLIRAETIDQSYQKITDWTTEQYAHAAAKNVPWLRRNRFLNTATLSTQTVSSVTATPLTVSFTGTGTITFSTAYVGTMVGTGAGDRVTATFTPAAGNLVCTVTGSVTLAQCEVAGAATEYQAVGASWDAQYADNASAAGVALTMYQDSAGTTAVSSPDQPTGLLVDLAQGMSAGSELITNGTFDTDTTGWTARQNATLSSVSGRLRITFNGTSYPEASQGITTVVGGVYTLSIDVVSSTATSCWVQLGTTAGGSQILNLQLAVGDNTTRKFVATSTTTYIGLYTVSTSGQYMDADNVSIKQVMGYHAIQSGASALRPALRLNSNGKWWIQRDLIDDAMVTTFPNLGANCVSYINDGTAVTETTGVTLNGALTQSTPGADYGRVYLGATSSKSAQIIKWLKAKAGL